MTQMHKFLLFSTLLLLSLVLDSCAKKHRLKVQNDDRTSIDLTTFGFLKSGVLKVNLTNLNIALQNHGDSELETKLNSFGFTLDKTSNSGISPDLETKSCVLSDERFLSQDGDDSVSIVFFRLDLNSKPPCIKVTRQGDLKNVSIVIPDADVFRKEMARGRRRRSLEYLSDDYLFAARRRRAVGPERPTSTAASTTTTSATPSKQISTSTVASTPATTPKPDTTVTDTIPLTKDPVTGLYSTYFKVGIYHENEEGLYTFFFHNCDNYNTVRNAQHKLVNFTIYLTESNYYGSVNYLSAGDMPLPTIYLCYSLVYFVMAAFWFYVLKRATDGIFKTHYLMFVFLVVKAISLLFHAIHFHFIKKLGHNEEAFAILYYITYLMKGTLLFVTIVLIGAGWAFVKHILSDRDKKIFVIVIPLQILANVAQIIIEETEEGQSDYLLWKQMFIMLDLLCCGAILFPVVWSIRHLQDASQTDGKAAINLVKLKIFRHFYILIVCYIYFTRIIVYLLAMTVPFQYDWVCTVFKETAALMFFVVTGYKFRPASDNPYLQIPQSDDEVEMEEVLTESGVTENLIRVNVKDPGKSTASTVKQRESSHEYD